ncbi:MAG: response regulator [Bacteroidales bacterium]|nr:response regulator [Bacteroidales bacterium]
MTKLLSIDDQRDNQITIRGALASILKGVEFHFALSGEEGISKARNLQPDIILLDIMMPGMDGFETCRRIKSDLVLRHIPIILLSAIGNKTDNRIKGLEIGADAVMSKPFDPGELASQINVMLRIKKAEDKLKEENIKLDELVNEKVAQIVYQATVLENVSDAVVSSDDDLRIRSWNEAAERTYGWKESEVLNRSYTEVLKPDYKEISFDQAVENLRKNGKYQSEVTHEHKDGSRLDILTSVSNVIDKNGINIGIVALNRDISKQKKAELEIDNLTTRLELAVKAVELGIWEWDLKSNHLKWNEEFNHLYGIDQSDSDSPITVLRNAVFYEDFNQIIERIRGLIKSGEKIVFEHKVKNPEKGIRYFVSKAVINRDEHGNATKIIGVSNDVTNRMKMEMDLKHSEERYRTMVENSNDLVWVSDLNGCFTFYNNHVEDVTGYNFKEFMGKSYSILLADSDKPRVSREYAKVLAGEKRQFEIMVYFAGGVEHVLWMNMAPVYEEEKVVGVVTFARDVSDYRHAMEEVKTALGKAKEADRLKSAFLATMSHELRTPLNAIIGFSSLMYENPDPDDIGKFAHIINESGQHLLSLVEQIFDITLIEAGQIKINKDSFDVVNLLKNIEEITLSERAILHRENLKVIFRIDTSIKTWLHSDKRRVQQILLNLLKNALKFTEEGHIECGYERVTVRGKHYIRFYVSDTGIGIADEKIGFIFDAFRQADDSHTRKYDGVGLGLSVAKKLTELLGGNLTLESKAGSGSTFAFTVPFSEQEEVMSTKNALKGEIFFNNKKVLVVEDDIDSYHLLELVLLKFGAVPVWTHNGKEAVDYCVENGLPWIVLMDLNMPLMNGLEATRIIKKMFPQLPVIVQTAYTITDDVRKARESGCDEIISKPIVISKLLDVLLKYN